MRRRSLFILQITFFFLLASGGIFAAGSTREQLKDDLIVTKWTTDDGLPQNTVTSIVQTRDGYLWLGTFGGLARFDGVKFTVFDSANTPVLQSNRVLSLFEDRWDRLWIGTDSGEIYVKDVNGFHLFVPEEAVRRINTWALRIDDTDHLFVSSDSGLERYSLDSNGRDVPGSGILISNNPTYGLFKHPDRSIWVRIQGKVSKVDNDRLLTADSLNYKISTNILRVDFAEDGSILCGGSEVLGVAANGTFRELYHLDSRADQAGFVVKAIGGSYWLQEGSNLIEFNGSSTIHHDLKGNITDGSRAVFQDDEDNIWLGTNGGGLVRLSKRKIGSFSEIRGFNNKNNNAMVEDRTGAFWLGGATLQRVENGKVETIQTRKDGGRFPLIKSLAIDRNDRLWVGGSVGVFFLENGQLVEIPEFAERQIYALYFDRDGALWAGGSDGLWRYSSGVVAQFNTENGLSGNSVHYITQTKDGTVWVGTVGGVSRIRDGSISNITVADGLLSNNVRAILEGEDGTVWLGTYGGGIYRLKDGIVRPISDRNGLNDNFISRILPDDAGRLWLLGNLGISAVAISDLNAVADSEKTFIASLHYDRSDGMTSSEANGGHQPAGIRIRDGKLLFPVLTDIVVIDPTATDVMPPRVMIENASSRVGGDKKNPVVPTAGTAELVKVSQDVRNLEIDFTGISFTRPESLHFFYRLDGIDSDWVDAGKRRTAFYPYLPSGNYTFQVTAINANGIWSRETAHLAIEVSKNFWQTWWFISLVVIVILISFILAYRYRTGHLRRRLEQKREFSRRLMSAHESERSRIANELHDGLGQNLLIIKNWAHAGLDPSSAPAEVEGLLRQISDSAAAAIDETRNIVKNLSPQNLSRFGLTEAIENMIVQLESSSAIIFERHLTNIDNVFSDESEISVYRIVQECLSNVVKHSQSPRAKVVIEHEAGKTTIIIEDLGIGFEPVRDAEPQGFGLKNIENRVRLMDGQIRIESTVSEGTRVEITLNS